MTASAMCPALIQEGDDPFAFVEDLKSKTTDNVQQTQMNMGYKIEKIVLSVVAHI